ncbi:hypothetical protein ACFOU2_09460 [Bacillus songklensis]|uniref:Uncharacterized protein n=1 Tax=Bacillus songklensis TaxID=1069116 RepID=A0ABV8B3A4_9BACI
MEKEEMSELDLLLEQEASNLTQLGMETLERLKKEKNLEEREG